MKKRKKSKTAKQTTSDLTNIWIRFADSDNNTPDYLFKILKSGKIDDEYFEEIEIVEGLYSKSSCTPGRIMAGDLKRQCRKLKDFELVTYKLFGDYKYFEGKLDD